MELTRKTVFSGFLEVISIATSATSRSDPNIFLTFSPAMAPMRQRSAFKPAAALCLFAHLPQALSRQRLRQRLYPSQCMLFANLYLG